MTHRRNGPLFEDRVRAREVRVALAVGDEELRNHHRALHSLHRQDSVRERGTCRCCMEASEGFGSHREGSDSDRRYGEKTFKLS